MYTITLVTLEKCQSDRGADKITGEKVTKMSNIRK